MPARPAVGVREIALRILTLTGMSSESILAHVSALQPGSVAKLYENVWSVVAVQRALPPLARQLIMRLAYLDAPADVTLWVATTDGANMERLADTLTKMRAVHVLDEPPGAEAQGVDARAVMLANAFREQLRRALSQRDTSPWAKGREVNCADPATQPQQLRVWAQRRWESLLHYMVGPALEASSRPEPGWKPPKEVKDELLADTCAGSSLMQQMTHTAPKISEAGFQFLVRPARSQVWQLLMDIIYRRRKTDASKADQLLAMVFQLSFCSLGAGYSLDALTKAQQELMVLLGHVGLVYFRPHAPRRFFPTHLVVDLCSEAPGGGVKASIDSTVDVSAHNSDRDAEVQDGKFLIVETNFRIYAYTTSVLQEQILRLFAQIIYKLPHLLIGVITRASIRNALTRGISASQIIGYMQTHAHPECGGLLEENITDQIRFWEAERKRIRAEPAVAYTSFASEQGFDLAVREARALTYAPDLAEDNVGKPKIASACLYQDKSELIIVVAASKKEDMRTFIEKNVT